MYRVEWTSPVNAYAYVDVRTRQQAQILKAWLEGIGGCQVSYRYIPDGRRRNTPRWIRYG
jgi:hypothetical protein